jgi:hypothetical protein
LEIRRRNAGWKGAHVGLSVNLMLLTHILTPVGVTIPKQYTNVGGGLSRVLNLYHHVHNFMDTILDSVIIDADRKIGRASRKVRDAIPLGEEA